MNPSAWTHWWWEVMAPLAIQGGVLLLAVAAVDALLPRRTWPGLRRALWLLALAKLLLPPTLASPVGIGTRLPAAWTEPFGRWALDPAAAILDPSAPERWVAMAHVVVAVWAVGVLGLLILGVLCSIRRAPGRDAVAGSAEVAASIGRAARRLGLRRLPRWEVRPGLPVPYVAVPWRPRVVLPSGLSEKDLDSVLLHELAHVRRGDLWVAAVVTLLQIAFWFHPLVWWARRRLDQVTEQCCDRTVCRLLGPEAASYRRTLIRFAARRHGIGAPALGFVGLPGALVHRLELLEGADREPARLVRLAATSLALLMLGVVLPMAPAAARSAATLAEWVERPPGCLPLRYLVLRRLAEEDGYFVEGDSIPSTPTNP